MPYTAFQIYNSSWQVPNASAVPASINGPRMDLAPIVRYHEPMARSGYGYPVQVNEEMFAEVGRPIINATGLAWWFTTAGISTSVYVQKYVVLYNPITQTWTSYLGYIWRPTWTGGYVGTKVTDFKVRITNLVADEP